MMKTIRDVLQLTRFSLVAVCIWMNLRWIKHGIRPDTIPPGSNGGNEETMVQNLTHRYVACAIVVRHFILERPD